MTKREDKLCYFVDEAGDPVLFGRRSNVVVGKAGVSNYFLLGKLEIGDPLSLANDLGSLRLELLNDPYFKGVPSMQPRQRKTAFAFHAKDDLDAVRREVYRVLLKPEHRMRFSAVVRDKLELVAYVVQHNARDAKYRYQQDEVYDSLVTELFREYHPLVDMVDICYALRGRRPRSVAFEMAIEKSESVRAKQHGKDSTTWEIRASTPPADAGLEAVDYFLWAVQRFFERKEERFVELIWSKVDWIRDLDFIEDGRRGVHYEKNKPLCLADRRQ